MEKRIKMIWIMNEGAHHSVKDISGDLLTKAVNIQINK